jgi:lycopene cyclase domain-containing protein
VGLVGVGVVCWALRTRLRWRPLHLVIGVMLILTAVFDNCLVAMQVFSYAPAHVSGWLIGRAPMEDFAYALAAALLMPALWERLRPKQ